MGETVPVSVGIPTWARGERVVETIRRLLGCDPLPAEIIVHVDGGDGTLERALAETLPSVRVLVSQRRVGPGGGRHRCLEAARQPIFASFDDDSWPMDPDYFGTLVKWFAAHPGDALVSATILHPGEAAMPRTEVSEPAVEFTGCGWAVRVAAYRSCPGFVDRPLAYGIEESDLGLQFFARGLRLAQSRALRVYHDTQLAHHRRPEQAAAAVQNVALLAWLRYPAVLWPRAVLQVVNMGVDQTRRGRGRGVPRGLAGLPALLWAWRAQRAALPAAAVRGYLARRRRPAAALRTAKLIHEPAPAST